MGNKSLRYLFVKLLDGSAAEQLMKEIASMGYVKSVSRISAELELMCIVDAATIGEFWGKVKAFHTGRYTARHRLARLWTFQAIRLTLLGF
ncbi:MAG: hypothetical protein ABH829_02620 [archaeon]